MKISAVRKSQAGVFQDPSLVPSSSRSVDREWDHFVPETAYEGTPQHPACPKLFVPS